MKYAKIEYYILEYLYNNTQEVRPIYKENFPERIKKAREESGYTQVQTADLTGIAQTIISKLERGRQEPNLEQLGILAQFYNVKVDWLLGVSIDTTNKERK